MKADPKRNRTEVFLLGVAAFATIGLFFFFFLFFFLNWLDDDELMLNVLRCHLTY